MIIIRDNNGNIIGKEASATYTPTRVLRARREQELCDKQMGIVREPKRTSSLDTHNMRRAQCSLEPLYDNHGYKPCSCEDYPCCGH
jgi:hypothetical protein